MSSSSKASVEGEWRAATDSKSGRTYYYHTKTKATTWTKPLELASPEERKLMIEQKEKTLAFFREMENNIRRKISEAALQDERNHMDRSNSVGTEEGFYYLDEREGSYELNDAKEVGICNRNVHFSHTAEAHSIDTMKVDRVLVRQTSGSGDVHYGNRDSLTSYDAGLGHYDPKMTGRTRKNSIGGGALAPPRRIRTISTMDDEILLTMRRGAAQPQIPNNVSGEKRAAYYNAPSSLSAAADDKCKYMGALQLNRETSKELGDRMAGRYPVPPADVNNTYLVEHMNLSPNPAKKPRTTKTHLKRRNSTGTIFLDNTMSNQDNNATIECVCVVIRAHMIDAAKENVTPLPEYDVFKDTAFVKKGGDAKGAATSSESNVPSLSTVKDFFQYLFSKSQLESDTIIMALIYCERLVKETKGKLCIRYDNWRSILFACLVMASKVWDDLSMWNVDFSQVYPSFDLRRVNTLELAMLDALKYVIRVSASEYAKYYFHLRSMMARLGLYQAGDPNLIRPLDLAGARKLQLSTEKYLEESAASVDTTRRRFYSVHETTPSVSTQSATTSVSTKSVGLEQLVSVDHMDADGQVHTSRKVSTKTDTKSTPKKTGEAKDAK